MKSKLITLVTGFIFSAFLLFGSIIPAHAITTSDFGSIFGSGSLLGMDFLGGATTGTINITGGGIGGDVEFAVWERASDGLKVLVYQITNVVNHVDQFVVGNPFNYVPVDISGGALTNAGGGLGYINTDLGVTPSVGAGLISGSNDYRWIFGITGLLGTPIPDGESSVRLYAAFNSLGVGGGPAELRDGVTVGNSPVVIPNPEPATILLFGSGLVGLGIWRYRRVTK